MVCFPYALQLHEHRLTMAQGNIDDSNMHDMVAIVASTGVSPIIRLAGLTGPYIKRALDTGAQYVLLQLID